MVLDRTISHVIMYVCYLQSNASRDNQRAEMLKLQNMADNFQSELKRQVDTLTAENDDIRKAFKKLLE